MMEENLNNFNKTKATLMNGLSIMLNYNKDPQFILTIMISLEKAYWDKLSVFRLDIRIMENLPQYLLKSS